MNFIKKHRTSLIVAMVCLILVILAVVAIYKMFYPNSGDDVYGPRLENAVEIDNAVLEKTKEDIKNLGTVNTVTYHLSGPTMKFFVDVKNDTTVEQVKEMPKIILDNFSKTVTTYYDIEIYFTQKEGKDASFPIIAYHSKSAEQFSFVINKENKGETDEK